MVRSKTGLLATTKHTDGLKMADLENDGPRKNSMKMTDLKNGGPNCRALKMHVLTYFQNDSWL